MQAGQWFTSNRWEGTPFVCRIAASSNNRIKADAVKLDGRYAARSLADAAHMWRWSRRPGKRNSSIF
jgi:hypothetical protein